MANKRDALRAKKAKRKKARRAGTTTVGEYERRKKQHDSEFESDTVKADRSATQRMIVSMLAESKRTETENRRNTMSKEEEPETITSEEYEENALTCIKDKDPVTAQVYATLSLSATIRESTFIFAEIIDPSDEDEDEGDGDEDDG